VGAPLLVRAGAPLQQRLDLGELALAAQTRGRRAGELQQLPDGLPRRSRSVMGDELELLLDAEAERAAFAEGVVYKGTSAVAGYPRFGRSQRSTSGMSMPLRTA